MGAYKMFNVLMFKMQWVMKVYYKDDLGESICQK